MLNVKLIAEYVKLLGMTVVFTLGQALAFGIILPLWAVANEIKN